MLRQVKSLLIIVTFLSAIGTILVITLSHHDQPPDPYAFDKATLAWQQQQLDATRSEQSAENMHSITQDAAPFLWGLVKLALLCLVSVCAVVGTDQYIQRRKVLVYPQNGYYPIARPRVQEESDWAAHTLDLRAHVDRIAARQPPHILHVREFNGPKFPEVVDGKVVPDTTPVPSFSQLVSQGVIGMGKAFMSGYDKTTRQPIAGGLKSTYSCAITGKPGSGKSTTQRFLILQAALQGARFVLCDPHAGVEGQSLSESMGSLQELFLAPIAVDTESILKRFRQVAVLMNARFNRPANTAKWQYPIILICDEWNKLMRSDCASELSMIATSLAQEGRKVDVYVFLGGQSWTAASSGGSELRDNLASKYLHRQARKSARLLIGTEDAVKCEGLATGECLLENTDGEVSEAIIPLTTEIDVKTVAMLLGLLNTDPRHTVSLQTATARYSGPVAVEVAPSSEDVAPSSDKPTQEEMDVFHDFMSGKNPAKIATDRYQMAARGNAWMDKSAWMYDTFRKVAKYYGLPDTVHISTAPVDNDVLVE